MRVALRWDLLAICPVRSPRVSGYITGNQTVSCPSGILGNTCSGWAASRTCPDDANALPESGNSVLSLGITVTVHSIGASCLRSKLPEPHERPPDRELNVTGTVIPPSDDGRRGRRHRNTCPDQRATSATTKRLRVSPIADIMSTGTKDSKSISGFALAVSRR